MPTKFVEPRRAQVSSPIDKHSLAALPPNGTIQFCGYDGNSKLTDADFRGLADVIAERPDVTLRAYGLGLVHEDDDLEFLAFFAKLRHFDLDCSYRLSKFDGLRHLPSELESLSLGQTKKKLSLRFLERFSKLNRLWLEAHRKDIEAVSCLLQLRKLSLRSITLPDLSLFLPLDNLEWFELKLGGTKNISCLPAIGKIRVLEIWRVLGLDDLSPISGLENLEYLFLEDLKHVRQLPSMKQLKHLRRVDLQNLTGVTDLSPLLEAESLEELAVYKTSHLQPSAFECLKRHPSLKAVGVGLGSKKKNDAVTQMLELPSTGHRPSGLID